MNRIKAAFLAALLVITSLQLSAQVIKLASPFPEGSPWDISLKKLASDWQKISQGKVRVRIYPGGVAGAELDTIRKMRFGQLDAAVLAAFGMKNLAPNSFVMSLPGILESEEELDFAIRKFAHTFDKDFIEEGFRVLAWSKSGWANFFSKKSTRTVDELKKTKLSVSGSDDEVVANFKAMGFNVVPLSVNEVMLGLQSSMVSSIYSPPMAAAAYQWFAQVPYMIDFPLAPVLGGIVISERTWQRIPKKFHEEFLEAADDMAEEFFEETEKLNREALKLMKDNGLTILSLTEAQTDDWYRVVRSGHALVVGDDKWIDQQVYDNFIASLEKFK